MNPSPAPRLSERQLAAAAGRSARYVRQARRVGLVTPAAEVNGRFVYDLEAVAQIKAICRPVFGSGTAPQRQKRFPTAAAMFPNAASPEAAQAAFDRLKAQRAAAKLRHRGEDLL